MPELLLGLQFGGRFKLGHDRRHAETEATMGVCRSAFLQPDAESVRTMMDEVMVERNAQEMPM